MGDLDATPERQLVPIPGPDPNCHHVIKRPRGADRVADGYGPAAGAAQVAQRWLDLAQPARARELYERALRILQTHFPTGHPGIDLVTRNLRATAPDVIVLDDGRGIDRPQSDRKTNP